ncbi:MAG: hypothetical protein LC776_02045 [Acidobacteria bacterium]|nr:hypothetical protein [Acidobacteriota bacterium]
MVPAPASHVPASVRSSVGGPASSPWREFALTRAAELEALSNWALRNHRLENAEDLARAIQQHLKAARDAAGSKNRFRAWGRSSLVQRAMGNLDAAEAQLLNLAPATYILGQIPSLSNHVQRHLAGEDPRRQEFERIVQTLGVKDTDRTGALKAHDELTEKVENERGKIVTAVRGASSAALREQLRVASFRNVLVASALVMTLLAVGVAVMGFVTPTAVPLCFEPEKAAQTVVVCPTEQSVLVPTGQQTGPAVPPDVDDLVEQTANRGDLLVVELIGLIAAAIAAAAAIRGIRGSSEPYGLPVALALLKLPTGAITAFLGLLLMRGQFLPGLSALDTSAQILAWAIIFGYAQQLFTRLVDQQAHTVLDNVRAIDKGKRS